MSELPPLENQPPVPELLSVLGLEKSFGRARVLKGVDFAVKRGEIHALLGANGAGKSTLIKILTNYHRPDRGTIAVRARSGEPGSVGKLAVVHQDLGLVDVLTVRENLQLDRGGITRGGLIDRGKEREEARRMLARVHLDVDPDQPLFASGLGEKSLIALARAFARDADVLVLDEVTAALTHHESEWLFRELRVFTATGGAVVVVSHRLQEIVSHCDAVTVLRDGAVAYTGETPNLSDLHALFGGGRQAVRPSEKPAPVAGVRPLVELTDAQTATVGPVTAHVCAGEVLGIVGSLSSNLYDIGHLIAGHAPLRGGDMRIGRREGEGEGTVAIVPEDRQRQGVFGTLGVADNITIGSLPSFGRRGLLRRDREQDEVMRMISDMNVQPPDPRMSVSALSGGNQQKVLMGRASLAAPDIYVLCEPTRGVDVKTRQGIYDFIGRVRDAGAAVVVITIDVDEALTVADRVAVMAGRSIGQTTLAEETDAERILLQL